MKGLLIKNEVDGSCKPPAARTTGSVSCKDFPALAGRCNYLLAIPADSSSLPEECPPLVKRGPFYGKNL